MVKKPSMPFPLPGYSGRCPHCGVFVCFQPNPKHEGRAGNRFYSGDTIATAAAIVAHSVPGSPTEHLPVLMLFDTAVCPVCKRGTVVICEEWGENVRLAFPMAPFREPVPESVPAPIAQDYREAALVLSLSPRASAALSRRCLQAVLWDRGFAQHNLADQIGAAIPSLDRELGADLDQVRRLGNFAAHPTKSQSTGEIVDVDPGEAEWALDVLDMLFRRWYMEPALRKEVRDALAEKIADAKKKPAP